MKKYDVFISYRRQGGRDCARILQQALERRGYRCFFDYDSLQDGEFNVDIYDAIKTTPNFLLVLTDGALERCRNAEDWVRIEIEHAQRFKKKIIPVVPSGQTANPFPDGLPDGLAELANLQTTSLNMENLFDESIDKMIASRFVKRRANGVCRLAVCLACVLALLACAIGIWRFCAPASGEPGKAPANPVRAPEPPLTPATNVANGGGLVVQRGEGLIISRGRVLQGEEARKAVAEAQKSALDWQQASEKRNAYWMETLDLKRRAHALVETGALSNQDADFTNAEYRVAHCTELSRGKGPEAYVAEAAKTRDAYKNILDRLEKELEAERKSAKRGETFTRRSERHARLELATLTWEDRRAAMSDFEIAACSSTRKTSEESVSELSAGVAKRIEAEHEEAAREGRRLYKLGMQPHEQAKIRPDLVMNFHDIRARVRRDVARMLKDGETEKAMIYFNSAQKVFEQLGMRKLSRADFSSL